MSKLNNYLTNYLTNKKQIRSLLRQKSKVNGENFTLK